MSSQGNVFHYGHVSAASSKDYNDGMAHSDVMSCVVNVADFSSRSYWDHRFAFESSFEWLQPSSALIPAISSELHTQQSDSVAILHLGSGSSDLSNRLRRLLSARPNASRSSQATILNVDFAAAAIELGRRHEREEFGDDDDDRPGDMHWAVVDVLDRPTFMRTCAEQCGRLFDLVVEKSCTDALACGPDVWLEVMSDGDDVHGEKSSPLLVAPELALATYLAAVTRPGGTWVALSYSAERFDFLRDTSQPVAALWTIEQVHKILAKDVHEAGHERTVYRPEIFHFVYIMKRAMSREN